MKDNQVTSLYQLSYSVFTDDNWANHIYLGKTALYLAAERKHKDIVDVLISSGSIIDQEIQDGNFIYIFFAQLIKLSLFTFNI